MHLKHIQILAKRRGPVSELQQRAYELDVSVWYSTVCPYMDFDGSIRWLTRRELEPDFLWESVRVAVQTPRKQE